VRAVIYARISSDDGTALGVTRQEQDCRALCDARGWNVAEVIVDNDVSAYSARRRPGYESLLDGLRGRRWDVLVVWHPDRLHRRPVELEEFIDVVETSGAQVSTVTAGEVDLSTPDGRLLARIVGSVARKESEDKSRRLRRKHLELAEAGEFGGGGRRPFGYEPGGMVVREVEAAEIRAAVARVLAGGSLRSICTDWNSRFPATGGGLWELRGVKRVLCSPRIAGLRQHQGEVIGPAKWPAIIDPDESMRVRAILAANNHPKPARSHLLAGWLVCGECEAKMLSRAHNSNRPGRKPRRIPRYVCSSDRGGCGKIGIAADPLDVHVGALVVDWLARRKVPAVEQPSPLPAIEGRLEELAEMWSAGEISRAEWSAARRSLEARRVVPVTPSLAGRDFRAEWSAADLAGRRDLVAVAVERIVIVAATSNRFDPNRAKVEWR
jgi:site-specific DNA recombinase